MCTASCLICLSESHFSTIVSLHIRLANKTRGAQNTVLRDATGGRNWTLTIIYFSIYKHQNIGLTALKHRRGLMRDFSQMAGDWGTGCGVEGGGAQFREAWLRHVENSRSSENPFNMPLAGHFELLVSFQMLGWIAPWWNPFAPDRGAERKIPSLLAPVTISYTKWHNSDERLALQPTALDSPVRTPKLKIMSFMRLGPWTCSFPREYSDFWPRMGLYLPPAVLTRIFILGPRNISLSKCYCNSCNCCN